MRLTIWLVAAVLAALASPGRSASVPPRPNLVLILSDDHRWDSLGAAGNREIATPHLDRLAAQGTYFRQGTIHVPQCSPSRATLLTGLPPHAHGHYSNQSPGPATPPPGPTLPGLLAAAGYRTVLVGKWHLPQEPWEAGFTDVRTWLPGGGGPYRDPELAEGPNRKTRRVAGFTQERFGDSAVGFLRSREALEKPFLLWLSFTAPHLPLAPNPQSARDAYRGRPAAAFRPPGMEAETDLPARRAREYYEAITALDEQVGRVLAALDETKLAPLTTVVFLGDNGWMFGSRGHTGKVVPYEESVRVPFIVRPSPAAAGRVSDAPVSSLDLPVSFLRWAGIRPPDAWPGRDLTHVVAGREDPDLTEAVSEWADETSEQFGGLAYRLVRTARHKLIRWKDPTRPDELYDLRVDPHERANLSGRPGLAAVERDLRARLGRWLERTGDPARVWPAAGKAPLAEAAR